MPKYNVVEVHTQYIRFNDVEADTPEEAVEAVESMDLSLASYRSDLELQKTLVYDAEDAGLLYDSDADDGDQRQHDIAVTAAINEALKEQVNDRP
jgi:hypothetical protein